MVLQRWMLPFARHQKNSEGDVAERFELTAVNQPRELPQAPATRGLYDNSRDRVELHQRKLAWRHAYFPYRQIPSSANCVRWFCAKPGIASPGLRAGKRLTESCKTRVLRFSSLGTPSPGTRLGNLPRFFVCEIPRERSSRSWLQAICRSRLTRPWKRLMAPKRCSRLSMKYLALVNKRNVAEVRCEGRSDCFNQPFLIGSTRGIRTTTPNRLSHATFQNHDGGAPDRLNSQLRPNTDLHAKVVLTARSS